MTERPDLNGLRVCLPYYAAIYLIDEGKKRWIPSEQVYNALFTPLEGRPYGMLGNNFTHRDGVIRDINIKDIANGSDIPDTAALFKYSDNQAVYLLDGKAPNHVKRWIASPAAMNHYFFNWDKIQVWNMPYASSNIPDGTPIRNPSGVFEFSLDHTPKTNQELIDYLKWRALL